MSESTWNDPRITSYVLNELSDEEREQFQQELDASAELAAAVDEARSVTDQLQGFYASESTPPLDSDRRAVIVSGNSQLPSQSDSGHDSRSADVATMTHRAPSWGIPLTVMMMAAMLLLLVGIAPWMRQQMTITAVDPVFEERVTKQGASEQMVGQSDPEMDSSVDSPVGVAESEDDSLVVSADTLQSDSAVPPEAARMVAPDAPQENAIPIDSVSVAKLDKGRQIFPRAAVGPDGVSSKLPANIEAALGFDASVPTESMNLPELMMPAEVPTPESAPGESGPKVGFYSEAQSKIMSDLGLARGRAGDADKTKVDQMMRSLERQDGAGLGKAEEEMSDLTADSLALAEDSVATVDPRRATKTKRSKRVKEPEAAPAMIAPTAPSDAAPVAAAPSATPSRASAGKPMVKSRGISVEAKAAPAGGGRGGKMKLPARDVRTRGADALLTLNSPKRKRPSSEAIPSQEFDITDEPFGGVNDGGEGPGKAGDRFEPIVENEFIRVEEESLSTFSVDVDTASYSKTRDFLLRADSLPRPDAVRIEELVNYFDYQYEPPAADSEHPFVARMVLTGCPWNQDHRLARIAIQGKTMKKAERPPCNLVFLLDTSGSMDSSNKLPLVVEGMKMLTEQLTDKDRVAIAVYASAAGLVLESTPATQRKKIRKALTELSAGGSTDGGRGIALAYHVARENFIEHGVNRVILCTDGDFNVGVTGTDELVRMVEAEAKSGTFLSVLGFGMGNHNDSMLEQVSGRGNGNYAFIDTQAEARKVLVDQTSGTLVTIAKDVKLQLEFNPKQVSQYRLIGYENRVLEKQDFNDDKKDAGEIGAGHSVTALYEIVPAGTDPDASRPKVDDLKYQKKGELSEEADSDEMLTLKLRYKLPDEDESTLIEFPVSDEDGDFYQADQDVRFAAAVAGFGMKLRRSKHAGTWTLDEVEQVAKASLGDDPFKLRAEFLQMVRKAKELTAAE